MVLPCNLKDNSDSIRESKSGKIQMLPDLPNEYRKDQQNDHPKVHYSIDKCWIDNYAWYMAKMEEIVSVIVTAVDTASLSALYSNMRCLIMMCV